MLSGETASGDFPLQSVQTMAKVAEHVDIALAHAQLDTHPAASGFQSTRALANAAVALTKETDVQRLLVATATGISVSLISAHRPRVPVTAMTDSLAAMRRTCILWGVNAVLVKEHSNSRLTIKDAVDQMLADGRMSGGDSFVAATGSPTAIHAPTNTVRLIQLDDDGEVRQLRQLRHSFGTMSCAYATLPPHTRRLVPCLSDADGCLQSDVMSPAPTVTVL